MIPSTIDGEHYTPIWTTCRVAACSSWASLTWSPAKNGGSLLGDQAGNFSAHIMPGLAPGPGGRLYAESCLYLILSKPSRRLVINHCYTQGAARTVETAIHCFWESSQAVSRPDGGRLYCEMASADAQGRQGN